MAPTSCSTVVSLADMVAMRVPSRMTWMRLATSSTCGIECEIRTTAMPLSLTRLIVSSTFLVWTTPSAAVGSSRKMILLAQVTARTIAICCRCPPDIVPTWALNARTVPPRSANPALAFARMDFSSMNPNQPRKPLPRDLAAEKHVLDRVEVRGEGEVLVDDLHAHLGRLLGSCGSYRFALEQELAAVHVEVAGHRLDHRRLAGTVVADQCDDFAGIDVEVRIYQGPDVTEATGKAARFEDGSHFVITARTRVRG